MVRVLMVDPDMGWMYGFPRPLPEGIEDVEEWLVENGYPRENVNYWRNSSLGHVPCRFWETEIETNSSN